MKFKKGDYVIYLDNYYQDLEGGEIFIIKKYSEFDNVVACRNNSTTEHYINATYLTKLERVTE